MADIDFGQLSEALNDKSDRDLRNVDITAKADAVIDFQLPTAENNYTWYRKYASGWVEQGGIDKSGTQSLRTITLPIAMANNNYTVSVQAWTDTSNSGNISTQYAAQTTTLSIGARWNGNWANWWMSWQVSGMAAN